MDIPAVTSAGKPCKLCKAKGRKCHLHGGTPKSGSPKKKFSSDVKVIADLDDLFGTFDSPSRSRTPGSKRTTPKSSPKLPTEFHYLTLLPKDPLSEVLLRMEWNSLSRVCHHVPQVRQICRDPYFQQKYLSRHKPPLFVDPELESDSETERGREMLFMDKRKTTIRIIYREHPVNPRALEVYVWFERGQGKFISIRIMYERSKEKITGDDFYASTGDDRDRRSRFDKNIFNKLGRPQWTPHYILEKDDIKDRMPVIMAFLTELKEALGTKVPRRFFDWMLPKNVYL